MIRSLGVMSVQHPPELKHFDDNNNKNNDKYNNSNNNNNNRKKKKRVRYSQLT